MLFMGLLLTLSGDQPTPSERALEEIPPELIGIYQYVTVVSNGESGEVLAVVKHRDYPVPHSHA